jgi:hypothetical protein
MPKEPNLQRMHGTILFRDDVGEDDVGAKEPKGNCFVWEDRKKH